VDDREALEERIDQVDHDQEEGARDRDPGLQGLPRRRRGLDLGGSSAQAVILMLMVIALTVLQFRYIERRV
jgi:hypothetical protein